MFLRLSPENEFISSSQCREDSPFTHAYRAAGARGECCGEPAKPEGCPFGLGDYERQRKAGLEERNQVSIKDLDPASQGRVR